MNQTANVTYIEDYVAKKDKATGIDPILALSARVEILERQFRTDGIGDANEPIPPERLYRDLSTDSSLSVIVRAREVLKDCISHLDQALDTYEDEIDRENEIEVALATFQKLDYLAEIGLEFQDAITLVQIASTNHRPEPYQRNELVALKTTMRLMYNNVRMLPEILDECLDAFESAGFDLSGSLANVDTDTLT